MKELNIAFLVAGTVLSVLISCSEDWLEVPPKGMLSDEVMANEAGINSLLIGAYSMLDGVSSQFGWEAASSNWVYGSIRGVEANKGSDAGDSSYDINAIQRFSETDGDYWSTNNLYIKWNEVYTAIARCNAAIAVIKKAIDKKSVDKEAADLLMYQARALRGWYHFEAWRMWEKICYVDESTGQDTLSNRGDARPEIIADMRQGIKLPDDMGQVGRFNGTVSRVLLAKAFMQMYHNYDTALILLDEARTGTKPNGEPIGLASTYGEIFDVENRNGIEAVYTVQYSVNDGSGGWNGGWGEVLNYPYKSGDSPGGGCCGFFQPTQELVNSFRTHPAGDPLEGLPYLETDINGISDYNNLPVVSDQGLDPEDDFTPDSGPLDPRLDWTVGRRSIPYWDWGKHTGSDWIRDQTYAGPYSPKKHVYKKSQQAAYTEANSWTSGFTANGYRMIRFADLLLLLAECQIETGNLQGARTNINLVRVRASNPDGFVMDGAVPAANYIIREYPATGYPFDSRENARKALYLERKLELGMEGHRWFDTNRWGVTVSELGRALEYEKTMPWGNVIYPNATVGPEDVTYPIPRKAIEESHGRLIQNR